MIGWEEQGFCKIKHSIIDGIVHAFNLYANQINYYWITVDRKTMNPLAGLEATLGTDLLKKIQTSKILLVGWVLIELAQIWLLCIPKLW